MPALLGDWNLPLHHNFERITSTSILNFDWGKYPQTLTLFWMKQRPTNYSQWESLTSFHHCQTSNVTGWLKIQPSRKQDCIKICNKLWKRVLIQNCGDFYFSCRPLWSDAAKSLPFTALQCPPWLDGPHYAKGIYTLWPKIKRHGAHSIKGLYRSVPVS